MYQVEKKGKKCTKLFWNILDVKKYIVRSNSQRLARHLTVEEFIIRENGLNIMDEMVDSTTLSDRYNAIKELCGKFENVDYDINMYHAEKENQVENNNATEIAGNDTVVLYDVHSGSYIIGTVSKVSKYRNNKKLYRHFLQWYTESNTIKNILSIRTADATTLMTHCCFEKWVKVLLQQRNNIVRL